MIDRSRFIATAGMAFAALGVGASAAPGPSKLPTTAVIRISRGRFEPSRFEEVDGMIRRTGEYQVPAIRQLPGLIAYHAGTSPDGFTTQVSLWESAAAGQQMRTLPEMRDRARVEAEALGVIFDPIVQYPINWSIAA
jgi:hypothetical protein